MSINITTAPGPQGPQGEWGSPRAGYYTYTDGPIDGFVRQIGELWTNAVYWDGELVDYGEWEGRDTAMRNCRRGIKAVRIRRNPLLALNSTSPEDEDLD